MALFAVFSAWGLSGAGVTCDALAVTPFPGASATLCRPGSCQVCAHAPHLASAWGISELILLPPSPSGAREEDDSTCTLHTYHVLCFP